ncbi:MAG: hypothetical protein ACTSO7_02465 [Candidatus Heimdallarchaeota archaeon]
MVFYNDISEFLKIPILFGYLFKKKIVKRILAEDSCTYERKTKEDIVEEVKSDLMTTEIFDTIQSLLMDHPEGITIEQLVTSLLNKQHSS